MTASALRVLVTRPAEQAAQWTRALRAEGIDAAALPLIGIAGAPSPAAVGAAWRDLSQHRLAVFVSPNAATRFMAQRPPGVGWPAGVRAASVGPGTTRTLIGLGVPAQSIVEPAADTLQFDSQALWAQLAGQDWRGARVLIVRGDGGRDWLAARLAEQGATVDAVAAYRRVAPELDRHERALLDAAIAGPQRHLWLFGSSQAVDHLAVIAPSADWSAACALATHPRIAERAQRGGFGATLTARATLAAVVACIQSMPH